MAYEKKGKKNQWVAKWYEGEKDNRTAKVKVFSGANAELEAIAHEALQKANALAIKVADAKQEPRPVFEDLTWFDVPKEAQIPTTLGELWVKWKIIKWNKGTLITDEQNWRNHIAPFFGADCKLKDIDREKGHLFISHQLAKQTAGVRKGGTLQPRAVNKHRTLLVGMLNEAYKHEWISRVPFIAKAKENNFTRNIISKQEIDRFLDAIQRETNGDSEKIIAEKKKAGSKRNKGIIFAKPWVKPMFYIMMECGLRHAEVVQLEWDDINLDAGTITIANDETFTTKTGKNRILNITPLLLPVLANWKVKAIAERNTSKYLFPKEDGHRRKPNDAHYKRAWNGIKTLAGLDHVANLTPYSLRSGFATRLEEDGNSTRAIMEAMGHSSYHTTLAYTKHSKPKYTISAMTSKGFEEELAMMYGYVRASKEEQQITIGAQEERIREYCKLYGIELAGIAFEHASGKNIKDRPVFKELLLRKDLTGIVVASLDRFSRSMKDFCNLMDNEMKGRTLISVKEKFDATDPIGAFTIQIMMAFAELERKTIGKRTKDALAEKKRRGEKLGGRLGMESNADGKTIQLLVKELRTEGLTIRGIAERLRNDNVTYEGKELSIATIHRLSKVA